MHSGWSRKKTLLLLIGAIVIEGIATFPFLLRLGSEPQNAVLLGFAARRIVFLAAHLALVGVFGALALGLVLKQDWFLDLEAKLGSSAPSNPAITLVLPALMVVGLALLAALVTFLSPLGELFGPLKALFDRSSPTVLWLLLVCVQLAMGILVLAGIRLEETPRIFDRIFRRNLLLAFLVVGTLAHWVFLIVRESVLANFKYWWGTYHPDPLGTRDLLVLPLLFLLVVTVFAILRSSGRYRLVVVLCVAALVPQVFALLDGGRESFFRSRLLQTNQGLYVANAGPDLSFSRAVRFYQDRYGREGFFATKPPGSLLFYIAAEKLANLGSGTLGVEGRTEALIGFAANWFPFVAVLALVPLYYLARSTIGEQKALIALLLLATLPNFVLMQMQLDQVLHPFVLVAGLLMGRQAIRAASPLLSFGLGLYCYLATFITFAMTFLVVWYLVQLGIALYLRRMKLPRALAVTSAFLLGALGMHLLFGSILDYNAFDSYSRAMAVHREVKLFQPDIGQIALAFAQNNLELLFWIGLPVAVLAGIAMWRALWRVVKKEANGEHELLAAFLIAYLVMNVFGQTRGEVGRLWVFLLPVVSIAVVAEMARHVKSDLAAATYLVSANLVLTFLMFKVHDIV